MQEQLIRFLAAMANGRSRERFAKVVLGHHDGVAADPRADQLLRSAGVLEDLPDGRVCIDEAAIKVLLGHARAALPSRPEPKLEQLPRHWEARLERLRELAERVLGPGERVAETELNLRLAELVVDVPRVRRAMVDDGVLARELDGSSYWRA